MSGRAVFKRPEHFVSLPLVESARLKIKGIQMDQMCAPLSRLILHFFKKPLPKPGSPAGLADPQYIYIRTVPAIHSGYDAADDAAGFRDRLPAQINELLFLQGWDS